MLEAGNSLSLKREVMVTRIPSGESLTLPAGTPVIVTQALGGSYTVVVPSEPGLFRVGDADADALGGHHLESAPTPKPAAYSEEALWDQLRSCYDPEIPVNIVDLGLVYGVETTETLAGVAVRVSMTLTAPGCGMGPSIAADAKQRLLSVPGVAEAEVELVWDPVWSPERISPAGRAKLGMD